jgi:hypothetical protein
MRGWRWRRKFNFIEAQKMIPQNDGSRQNFSLAFFGPPVSYPSFSSNANYRN